MANTTSFENLVKYQMKTFQKWDHMSNEVKSIENQRPETPDSSVEARDCRLEARDCRLVSEIQCLVSSLLQFVRLMKYATKLTHDGLSTGDQDVERMLLGVTNKVQRMKERLFQYQENVCIPRLRAKEFCLQKQKEEMTYMVDGLCKGNMESLARFATNSTEEMTRRIEMLSSTGKDVGMLQGEVVHLTTDVNDIVDIIQELTTPTTATELDRSIDVVDDASGLFMRRLASFSRADLYPDRRHKQCSTKSSPGDITPNLTQTSSMCSNHKVGLVNTRTNLNNASEVIFPNVHNCMGTNVSKAENVMFQNGHVCMGTKVNNADDVMFQNGHVCMGTKINNADDVMFQNGHVCMGTKINNADDGMGTKINNPDDVMFQNGHVCMETNVNSADDVVFQNDHMDEVHSTTTLLENFLSDRHVSPSCLQSQFNTAGRTLTVISTEEKDLTDTFVLTDGCRIAVEVDGEKCEYLRQSPFTCKDIRIVTRNRDKEMSRPNSHSTKYPSAVNKENTHKGKSKERMQEEKIHKYCKMETDKIKLWEDETEEGKKQEQHMHNERKINKENEIEDKMHKERKIDKDQTIPEDRSDKNENRSKLFDDLSQTSATLHTEIPNSVHGQEINENLESTVDDPQEISSLIPDNREHNDATIEMMSSDSSRVQKKSTVGDPQEISLTPGNREHNDATIEMMSSDCGSLLNNRSDVKGTSAVTKNRPNSNSIKDVYVLEHCETQQNTIVHKQIQKCVNYGMRVNRISRFTKAARTCILFVIGLIFLKWFSRPTVFVNFSELQNMLSGIIEISQHGEAAY